MVESDRNTTSGIKLGSVEGLAVRPSNGPSREAGRPAGPSVGGPPPAGPDLAAKRAEAAARAREWRAENPERARELARDSARRRRQRDPDAIRDTNRRYRDKNREKYRARGVLMKRVERGTIARPGHCEACAVECKPQAHHHDYSKPFDVRWLCRDCHWNEHRAVAEREQGAA